MENLYNSLYIMINMKNPPEQPLKNEKLILRK